MNIIKSFNNTIDYLETVLDDEIDEKKVAQLSGYSYLMFSRLFSILTETTLSEYLRSRRLTEAAVILRDTDEKIISFHLNKIRWKIEDNYYIIHFSSSVVDFSDETEQKTYIFRIKKVLNNALTICYENAIVSIVRAADYSFHDLRFRKHFDELLQKINLKCGISMNFNNFME